MQPYGSTKDILKEMKKVQWFCSWFVMILVMLSCNSIGDDQLPERQEPEQPQDEISIPPGSVLTLDMQPLIKEVNTVRMTLLPTKGVADILNGFMIYRSNGSVGQEMMAMDVISPDGDVISGEVDLKIVTEEDLPLCAGAISDVKIISSPASVAYDVLANDRFCRVGDYNIQIKQFPSIGSAAIENNIVIYTPVHDIGSYETYLIYEVVDAENQSYLGYAHIIYQQATAGCTPIAQDDTLQVETAEIIYAVSVDILKNDQRCDIIYPEDISISKPSADGNVIIQLDGTNDPKAVFTPNESIAVGSSFKTNFQYTYTINNQQVNANVTIDFVN